jgi:Restriction endonuclease
VTRSKKAPPGKALEIEVLELLKGAGFRAHRNARVAKPRQTDILARGNDMTLLVEVKDRKRSLDINDIDSLRSRLNRTTPEVIGVFFTQSSISRPAIKEIESNRASQILIFVSSELDLLRAGKARLLNLIEKKRSELLVSGRAWFRTGEGGEYLHVPLPKSTMEFVAGQSTSSYFCSKADFAHSTFSTAIPDTSGSNPGGDGVRLSLSLSLSTLDQLKDLFGYLHDAFGLSANGAFSIHQDGACWHGVGVENLLKSLRDPWARYRAASMDRVHHSEGITYFDQFRNGSLLLYTRQRVPEGRKSPAFLHETDVCIQLPGVPVDAAPYLELCRYTGNEWASFGTILESRRQIKRLKKSIQIEVVGTLVRTDEDREADRWIVGLVARNPFYRKKKLPRELELDGSPLHDLLELELLLCDLKDHHQEGDQVDHYVLQGVETTDAQFAQIIRPFGTWHEIVKRIRDGQPVQEVPVLDLPEATGAAR